MEIVREIDVSDLNDGRGEMRAHYYTDDDGIYMLEIVYYTKDKKAYNINFNAEWVPDDKEKWLADVLAMQLKDNVLIARYHERKLISSAWNKFKNILEER